jgi:hypothetical protein
LGAVVYLGRHGEGVFEGCQPPRSAVLTDARAAYDTALRGSIGYHPPEVSYPVAPPACGPHSRRRWMSLAASHAGAALPYRDSPLWSPQRSMASPCSPPEVSGNRSRGWRPSRRTSDRWYRPHSQVHRDGQHSYWPQALSCIPLELQPFKKFPGCRSIQAGRWPSGTRRLDELGRHRPTRLWIISESPTPMKSILETLFEHSWVGVLLLCWYLMMHELKLHPLLLWALILFLVVVSMWGMAVFFL